MSTKRELSFGLFEASYLYLVDGSSDPLRAAGLFYSTSSVHDQSGSYHCERDLPGGKGSVLLRYSLSFSSSSCSPGGSATSVYEITPLGYTVLPTLFHSPPLSLPSLLVDNTQKVTGSSFSPFGSSAPGASSSLVESCSVAPVDNNNLFGAKLEGERGGSVSPPLIEYKSKNKTPFGILTGVDVDTVKLSLYGSFDDSILDYLEEYKQQAVLYDGLFPCSGRLVGWSIKPYGSSQAGMSYILYCGDIVVMVGRGNGKKAANFSLSIGSLSCHEYDLLLLSSGIYELFGFTVEKELLSRGDLCRDASCDLSAYKMHILDTQNWFWKRKVKLAYYFDGDVFTGFQFGRGSVVMRCYDKGYELLDKNDCRKVDYFHDYLQVDFSVDCVWRLEYQMRREYFRSVGVQTLADFLEKKEEIWSRLVNDWVFLSEGKVIRNSGNSSAKGTKMHEVWKVYLNDAAPIERCSPVRVNGGTDRVFRQGVGCVLSYVMKTSGVSDFSSLVDKAKDAFDFFLNTQEDLSSWMGDNNKYHRRLSNYVNSVTDFEPVPF